MVKKWEIWFLSLDPTQGSEQKGIRPVLVISNDAVNDNLSVFTCIPFSSVKPGAKVYPTEVMLSASESGLSRDSVLMLQQIRTVSEDRLLKKAATLADEKIKERINRALIEYFELTIS